MMERNGSTESKKKMTTKAKGEKRRCSEHNRFLFDWFANTNIFHSHSLSLCMNGAIRFPIGFCLRYSVSYLRDAVDKSNEMDDFHGMNAIKKEIYHYNSNTTTDKNIVSLLLMKNRNKINAEDVFQFIFLWLLFVFAQRNRSIVTRTKSSSQNQRKKETKNETFLHRKWVLKLNPHGFLITRKKNYFLTKSNVD